LAWFVSFDCLDRRTHELASHPHKKRRTQTHRMPPRGSARTFPQPQMLYLPVEAHYNHSEAVSIRLMGGLAMIARHSCIAGPSVFSTLSLSRFLYGLHHPFSSMDNKKGASRRLLLEERVCWCLHGVHARAPCIRTVAAVCSGDTPVSVKPLIRSIVRYPHAESKSFS